MILWLLEFTTVFSNVQLNFLLLFHFFAHVLVELPFSYFMFGRLFSYVMDQFNLLVDLCRVHCKEVSAVSPVAAAKFQGVSIVTGVACSYNNPELQELAVSSTDLTEILQSFTNWGENFNIPFPVTKLFTALMPKEKVNDLGIWFNSAIIFPGVVHEPILLLSTGNCLTGFQADSRPPTEVVPSLLRGRKLRIFASPGSQEAANLLKRPEANHLDCLLEDMIFHRHKNLPFCVQEAGDTVCFPARTVHFVLSVAVDGGWNCLPFGHNGRLVNNQVYRRVIYLQSVL